MSDLDKMMNKLKKTKETKVEDEKETPTETPKADVDEEIKDPVENPVDDDTDEVETPKETPKEEEKQEINVEQEVAILQNEGVYRRELLSILREISNVHKVATQSLIDLNKLIGGALNGKK